MTQVPVLAEAQPSHTRPRSVTVAVIAVAAGVVFSLAVLAFNIATNPSMTFTASAFWLVLTVIAAVVAPAVVALIAVQRQQRWAPIAVTIAALWNGRPSEGLDFIVFVAMATIAVVAIVAVWLPPSRKYLRNSTSSEGASKSAKTSPAARAFDKTPTAVTIALYSLYATIAMLIVGVIAYVATSAQTTESASIPGAVAISMVLVGPVVAAIFALIRRWRLASVVVTVVASGAAFLLSSNPGLLGWVSVAISVTAIVCVWMPSARAHLLRTATAAKPRTLAGG